MLISIELKESLLKVIGFISSCSPTNRGLWSRNTWGNCHLDTIALPRFYRRLVRCLTSWICHQNLDFIPPSMFPVLRASWDNMRFLFLLYHMWIQRVSLVQNLLLFCRKGLINWDIGLSLRFWFSGKGWVKKMLLGKTCFCFNNNFHTLWARCFFFFVDRKSVV